MIDEVKHFDAYEQETYRNTPQDDNMVSDRVLHEIYDPPFQQAVTKGGAQSLMCSYASVNGEYSCQDPYLLSTTVDQRWGYDGFVQSDFSATHSTVASALAGLDLEMPTGDYYAQPMEQAVVDGQVPIATVNQMLVDRFAAMIRAGLFSHPVSTSPIPAQADGDFSLSAAEQGMVLLKNSGSALPLSASSVSSIAVIGPYAGSAMTGGGGSSKVDPLLTVSPVQGIENADPGASVTYDDGSDITSAVAAAKAASVAVVMVGDTESEGADQSSLSLSGDQDALVSAVAAANPRTIVVVKSGNPVLMPWVSQVPAVLEAWYPGEEDGDAVAAVLFGSVDPSGKLPVTFPVSESATPTSSQSQFPGTNGQIQYTEGLDVGYRGYDAEDITPMFPFGYGLSYTTFAFSDLKVSSASVRNPVSGPGASSCDCNGQGTRLETVSATVTNTGKVAGADVAQLYLGDPAAAGEPSRQLEGFDKVSLKPGQSARVSFPLTGHALSYWDDTANGWVLPDGGFQVYVGDSSALSGLPLHGGFAVTRTVGARYATLTTPSAAAGPGATIPVSATFTNDGAYAVTGGVPALRLPAGWTATSEPGTGTPATGGPADVNLAPGQSVTEHWSVRVPVSAQGTTASLGAALTQGRGGPAVGSLSTTATVTVQPALTVSTASVLASAGGSATATLNVTSNLAGPATLSYTASPPPGVTVTPARGTVTVPPAGAAITLEAQAAPGQSPGNYAVPLSLSVDGHALNPGQVQVTVPQPSVAAAFDNTGISDDTDTGAASFDGDGASYSAQALASAGVTPGADLSFDGIGFTWPDVAAGQPDNVVADGQTVDVSGQGSELGILDSSTYGVSSGTGTITYTDGTTQSFSLTADDWYKAAPSGSNAVIVAPYRNTPGNVQDQNVVNVFEQSVPLQAGKTVAAVTLPDISAAAADGTTTLHVFAIGIGG
jgi:beta-glucosidase